MAVIFGLVLEFFLTTQVDNASDLKVEKQYMTAQIMYTVAKQRQAKLVRFDKGTVETIDGKKYSVKLSDGKTFIFGG